MKRVFLGLPVNSSLSVELERLHESAPGVRWIPARKLHLTLVFLGACSDGQLRELSSTLHRIRPGSIRLRFTDLKVLPDLRRARVLAAVLAATEPLQRLHAVAIESAAHAGVRQPSRRLSPHITVARLKRPSRDWLHDYVERRSRQVVSLPPFRTDRLNLYQSILTPAGSEYEILDHFNLTSAPSEDR